MKGESDIAPKLKRTWQRWQQSKAVNDNNDSEGDDDPFQKKNTNNDTDMDSYFKKKENDVPL